MKPCCKNCAYWSDPIIYDVAAAAAHPLEAGTKFCRRFPPGAEFFQAGGTQKAPHWGSQFPITQPDTWCGEFEAKA